MRKFLLYSSALAVFGFSDTVLAACIQTPSCSSLGYDSSTSCEGGIKCPFGEAWNCSLNEKITELEKIIEEIKSGCCQSNCQVGDILYSDMTLDANFVRDKTPIGVVFDCNKKLAIGLERTLDGWVDSYKDWGDIPGINNFSSSTDAKNDFDGKKNTNAILAYCKANGLNCTGIEYVSTYKTEGTNAGDWYLPAAGELYSLYINQSALNEALNKVNAGELGSTYEYWSSSEYSSDSAWYMSISFDYFSQKQKQLHAYIVPVLAFSSSASGGDQQTPDNSNCKVGDILYSDKSCSTDVVSGKTPIAVIFDTSRRLALALNGNSFEWGIGDCPEIKNYDFAEGVTKDFNGKNNTASLIIQGSHPAADYAYNYTTEGTQAGNWYLPAAGELKLIADNSSLLSLRLETVGGKGIGFGTSGDIWSSSESTDNAWLYSFADGFQTEYKGYKKHVRPVLAY